MQQCHVNRSALVKYAPAASVNCAKVYICLCAAVSQEYDCILLSYAAASICVCFGNSAYPANEQQCHENVTCIGETSVFPYMQIGYMCGMPAML